MRRLFTRIVVILFFLAVAAFGCFRIIDTDVWLYLRVGERVFDNLRPPSVDVFSYTAGGRPWIDVHWLAQTLLWLVYAGGGAAGLSLLRLAIVLSIFALLYRCCRYRASPAIVIAVLLPALLTANDSFLVKPYLISLLLAVLFLYILERGRLPGRRFPWLLIPLQAAWANMHPSFFLGPLLILFYILDSLLRPSAPGRPDWKKLAICLACVSSACLLTPYGLALFAQPWEQVTTRIYTETVIPWTPAPTAFPAPFAAFFFRIMAWTALVSCVLNARRLRPADVLIFILFGWLAAHSRRHLALFALLASPGICFNLGSFAATVKNRFPFSAALCKWALVAALIPALGLAIEQAVTSRYYYRERSLKRFGLGKSEIAYPDAAMDFIRTAAPGKRVFCNYDIGSYFAGLLYPDYKVFIDGRNLVYGEKLFRTYLDAVGSIDELDRIADEYKVDAILLTHNSRDVKGLLPALYKSRGWTLAYVDDRAVVFLRRGDAPEAYRVELGSCGAPLSGPGGPFPISQLRAGELYYSLGFMECSAAMFREALNLYPRLPEAHNFLGMIALRWNEEATAEAEFLKACAQSGSFAEPRLNLATTMLGEGKAGEAEHWAREAIRIDPSSARGYGVLGLSYFSRGDASEASRCLEEAARRDPEDAEYHSNLGAVYEGEGDFAGARAEYEKAIALSKGYFAPRYNLALLDAKSGDKNGAVELFLEALRINPRHAGARKNLAAIYYERKEYGKAREQLERVLGVDPADTKARAMLRKIGSAETARDSARDAVPGKAKSARELSK